MLINYSILMIGCHTKGGRRRRLREDPRQVHTNNTILYHSVIYTIP